MNCLGCHEPLTSKTAKLYRKIMVCPRCSEFAMKQEKELRAASARALEQSLIWLEQQVLRGELLKGTTYVDEPEGTPDPERSESPDRGPEESQ